MNLLVITILLIVVILLIWLFARTRTTTQNQNQVDWNRYIGTWYEIARLPTPFENGCRNATAQYSLNNDNNVSIVNKCEIDGKIIEARGVGKIISGNSLSVKFDNTPAGQNYIVLFVDPDYQTALVGSNNKNYLWILARSQTINQRTLQKLLQLAQRLGYDTNKLIINRN